MLFSLKNVWAKTVPHQSIITHSTVSGVIAQTIFAEMLSKGVRDQLCSDMNVSEEELVSFIGYYTSLHDLGKIEGGFQWNNPEIRPFLKEAGLAPVSPSLESIRHELTTGESLKWELWENHSDKGTRNLLIGVLEHHHQGKNGRAGFLKEGWSELRREFHSQMCRQFLGHELTELPVVPKEKRGAVGAVLQGIVVLADWIASGAYFETAESWGDTEQLVEETKERAEVFLKLSGLCREAVDFGTSFTDMWPFIQRNGMRPLQREAEELFRTESERISMLLIEAPMGEGKTEAGLYAAQRMNIQWGKSGFYVGLPTAATSNQMVDRIRTLMELHHTEQSVKLLHSMAWLTDHSERKGISHRLHTEEERFAVSWLQPTRRGLLSSYAVGTVDQAMMAALKIKYGCLRLLGMAEKALVIDELHSYDVYMSEIIQRLLQWCKELRIPVILLSATLPPEKKQLLMEVYAGEKAALPDVYPAITAVTESGRVIVRRINGTAKRQCFKVRLLPILNDSASIAKAAMEAVEDDGCICVLLNTVQQAQQVYTQLKEKMPDWDGELMLFHARFPLVQRDQIEKRCIRLFGKDKTYRPAKAILVATQVVEQSLDVDFDYMLTSVAPIDLILQRMGRVFRHDETYRPAKLSAPSVGVLIPSKEGAFGVDGMVYPSCLLQQSVHLLEEHDTIRIPEDMQQMVADGYDCEKAPPEELESWMENLIENQVQASYADGYLIPEPKKGYIGVKSNLPFDDLEEDSYLSAKTRLGEPSERIALIPQQAFDKMLIRAERRGEELILSDVHFQEAKDIMMQTVSLRKSLLKGCLTAGDFLRGEKLLQGVKLFRAQQQGDSLCWIADSGRQIIADAELGIIIKDGEKKA